MATENENGKRLRLTKQVALTSSFFVHFFAIVAQPRRETSWFHVFWRTTRQGFFLKLGCSTLEFNSKKFTNIWQIERYGIKAMNFDTGWIHLLRDFFARVVLVVANKLPNVLWKKWTRANDLFFFFWTYRYSPLLEFNSSKIRQYLTNWARWNKSKEVWSRANQFTFYVSFPLPSSRGTQRQFSENICLEDNLRSTIFGTFVENFLACLPLLGFSNI